MKPERFHSGNCFKQGRSFVLLLRVSIRLAMIFGLSGRQVHDAPEGRVLLESSASRSKTCRS